MSNTSNQLHTAIDMYAAKAQRGDELALDRLKEALDPIIERMCRKRKGMLEFEDAVSYAYLAMLSCLESWQEGRGARFAVFFSFRLRSRLANAQPKPREMTELKDIDAPTSWEPPSEHMIAFTDSFGRLQGVDRTIIRMTAEGSSTYEIGRSIGYSSEYVRQRVARFREHARSLVLGE